MTALAIFLTFLILFASVAVVCFVIDEVMYEDEDTPEAITIIGGLAVIGAGTSMVASLITTVWVVLT